MRAGTTMSVDVGFNPFHHHDLNDDPLSDNPLIIANDSFPFRSNSR